MLLTPRDHASLRSPSRCFILVRRLFFSLLHRICTDSGVPALHATVLLFCSVHVHRSLVSSSLSRADVLYFRLHALPRTFARCPRSSRNRFFLHAARTIPADAPLRSALYPCSPHRFFILLTPLRASLGVLFISRNQFFFCLNALRSKPALLPSSRAPRFLLRAFTPFLAALLLLFTRPDPSFPFAPFSAFRGLADSLFCPI